MNVPISILSIDHIVLTSSDIDKTLKFYTQILGCKEVTFGEGRKAIVFGHQKINIHSEKTPIKPHAKNPYAGTLDICFIIKQSIEEVIEWLNDQKVSFKGVYERTGAQGAIRSIYIRDPDENLIELAQYFKSNNN